MSARIERTQAQASEDIEERERVGETEKETMRTPVVPAFRFELIHTSKRPGSKARVGRIITPHGVLHRGSHASVSPVRVCPVTFIARHLCSRVLPGDIMTPAFVPVGTNAALKAIDEKQASSMSVRCDPVP